MSVYYNDQRKRWCYNFICSGKRFAGYCKHPDTDAQAQTKTEAKRIENLIREAAQRRIEAEREKRKADAPANGGVTLAMILAEYVAKAAERNRSAFNNIDYAAELLTYFGPGRLLSDITVQDIEGYRRWCQAQTVKAYVGGPRSKTSVDRADLFRDTGKERSASTVNKYLLALEAAWQAAHRRHASRMPAFPACPEIEYLPTGKHTPNPVQAEHMVQLLGHAPHHLLVTMALATHTSMRLDEILGLEWDEVNFDLNIIRLRPERTKSGDSRVIHLTGTARAVLDFLALHRPDGQPRVVLYWPSGFGTGTPLPIGSIRTAWLSTLRAAGLAGKYRFHDLRGVVGTFLAGDGVDALTLQKWLGHRDIKTTLRYIALADPAQQTASRRADAYPGTDGIMARIATPAPRPSTREDARKFVGVYPAGKTRYEARIVITTRDNGQPNKCVHYLGCFDDAETAALAYDAEARKIPGRRLNFPAAAAAAVTESQTPSHKRKSSTRSRQ